MFQRECPAIRREAGKGRASKTGLLALLVLSGLFTARAGSAQEPEEVEVHYLGHASFLLRFPTGVTVLTDYGESNAWGLESPIHTLGSPLPDLITISHDHLDHAGGERPAEVPTLTHGDGAWQAQGLGVFPIPTFEGNLAEPDNTSFLFSYGDLRILHLGDCQGLMVALGAEEPPSEAREEVEATIQNLYPDRYDLVLLPIGFTRDILREAMEFLALLDVGQVIPMHYWTPTDRDTFLARLEGAMDGQGRPYRTEAIGGGRLILGKGASEAEVLVWGLEPGPAGRRAP